MSKHQETLEYLIKRYLKEKGKNHTQKDIYEFEKELIEKVRVLNGEN